MSIINGKDGGRYDEDGNIKDYARVRFATYYDRSGNKQSLRVTSSLWVKDKDGNDVMSDEQLRQCITSLIVVESLDRQAYEQYGKKQYHNLLCLNNKNIHKKEGSNLHNNKLKTLDLSKIDLDVLKKQSEESLDRLKQIERLKPLPQMKPKKDDDFDFNLLVGLFIFLLVLIVATCSGAFN
ncbi:MAG: hypothetical protein J6M30_08955 [Bacteroidales bacterium]|nr:hypothetical protein [Bacteroidales bacterium]